MSHLGDKNKPISRSYVNGLLATIDHANKRIAELEAAWGGSAALHLRHIGELRGRVEELESENAALKEQWLKEKESHDRDGVALVKMFHDKQKLEADLATKMNRIAELEAALHRDKTGLAKALVEIKERARGGAWIGETRGSYEWDDDAYMRETGLLVNDIIDLATKALGDSGNIAQATLAGVPR